MSDQKEIEISAPSSKEIFGAYAKLLRVAITGDVHSPGNIFDIMERLGKEECLKRMKSLMNREETKDLLIG